MSDMTSVTCLTPTAKLLSLCWFVNVCMDWACHHHLPFRTICLTPITVNPRHSFTSIRVLCITTAHIHTHAHHTQSSFLSSHYTHIHTHIHIFIHTYTRTCPEHTSTPPTRWLSPSPPPSPSPRTSVSEFIHSFITSFITSRNTCQPSSRALSLTHSLALFVAPMELILTSPFHPLYPLSHYPWTPSCTFYLFFTEILECN